MLTFPPQSPCRFWCSSSYHLHPLSSSPSFSSPLPSWSAPVRRSGGGSSNGPSPGVALHCPNMTKKNLIVVSQEFSCCVFNCVHSFVDISFRNFSGMGYLKKKKKSPFAWSNPFVYKWCWLQVHKRHFQMALIKIWSCWYLADIFPVSIVIFVRKNTPKMAK